MTSDRGNGDAAELQLTPNSVTQKSPGLNPNATEFLSKQDVHHWDDINADGYQFANGDINKLEGSSRVFSPAAGSEPPLQPISADFTPAATVTGPVPLLPVSPAPPPAAVTDQIVSAVNTGPAGGGGGGGAGAGTASAGTIIGTTGIPTTSSPLIYSTQTETATLQDESPAQVDGTLSDEQIRKMLKSQLEYYFSRENLTSDTYLMSQMDADQYVAISAVASFSQVQRLTSNLDLVVDVLRECQNVQVDEKGEKVRPNHNRCIVILREIPATTPVEEVENLFSGTNCPKFVSCEFAHNDNWYVTFDSDEDAQRAYQYLREEVKSFLGKPIMARIKAKPLIRPSYVPRNGLKPHFEQQTFPSPQRYAFLPNLQYGQQVFYHPGHAVLSSWAPAAPTIMDPSMQVFAMNGYQATGVKLNATGRHQFANIRVSRTPKPHRLNQERASSDSRLSHDRHQNPNAHRSSPRSTENAHVAAAPFLQRKSSENSGHHNNHPLHHIQQHSSGAGISGSSSSGGGGGGGGTGGAGSLTATVPVHHSSTASDSSAPINVSLLSDSTKDSPASQPQRKLYNKGRRKKDEDYSKLSRQNSSQISANNKYTEPQFEFESNSFPPLPGSQNNASSGERFENKMSDVVRGTAKPLAKESVIASPVVAAPASSSSSSPSSSTTGVPATGTNAVVVVAPPPLMSTSSSSSSAVTAIGLNTQAPLLASTLLQSAASKEVSTAVASSILAPPPPPPAPASTVVSSSSLALASAPAVAPPATVASASHLPLIAATSTLSSSASATSANNRALAQTSQPVCLTNKPSCAIASPSGKLNCVNPVDHSKSADSHHPVNLVGGSQSHQVAVVTSPPTAAAAVATTTASPKEAGVGSATSCAHATPASSSQSLSVSSLPLSSLSSSGHALQAPPPSGASSSSSSSSTQQGHSRPGQQQAAALQGIMTSSAGATSSSATLTATSTLALQQQQQNAKVSAMEERATSKLSYAQMVARKRDPGNDGGAPMSNSEKSQGPVSQQTPSAALQQQQQQVHSGAGEASMCKMMSNNLLQPTSSSPSQRSQALKEQSQALKVSSPSAAHMQLPPKEHILRKDLEPKEQRFNMSGRRPAKENRERQRRKTDRERTSK